MKYDYALEKIDDMIDEVHLLLVLHYEEIAHFKDIKLNPDFDTYFKLDQQGLLRIFTVRDQGRLIGYNVFFIKEHLHYMDSLQAVQDVVFIKKEHRGGGGEFIAWCDEKLKSEGVQTVYHHVKAAHNFGKMLERQGYELVDLIYGKRL